MDPDGLRRVFMGRSNGAGKPRRTLAEGGAGVSFFMFPFCGGFMAILRLGGQLSGQLRRTLLRV